MVSIYTKAQIKRHIYKKNQSSLILFLLQIYLNNQKQAFCLVVTLDDQMDLDPAELFVQDMACDLNLIVLFV